MRRYFILLKEKKRFKLNIIRHTQLKNIMTEKVDEAGITIR